MNVQQIKIDALDYSYPVHVGSGLLDNAGELILGNIGHRPGQVIVFSDDNVFALYGEKLISSLESVGLRSETWTIPHGEEQKRLPIVEESLDFFSRSRLTRSDIVIALGGGVVGDIAGFCSALYMRGVRYVQIPTTLLAMVDSSVGGKTGVNNTHGKNLLGAFHHPEAVIADINTLKTLEKREIRAGFYELVKHGALGGMDLFDLTRSFLVKYPLDRLDSFFDDNEFESRLIDLIASQIAQKASIVAQDQREDPARKDSTSRKVLNFGHTVAHALERATEYKYFRHGEAVGYGILVANEIAKILEFCDDNSINLLNDVVLSIGELPKTLDIDVDSVFNAIAHDKKTAGKIQQWILLESIGHPQIISGDEFSTSVIRDALNKILQP